MDGQMLNTLITPRACVLIIFISTSMAYLTEEPGQNVNFSLRFPDTVKTMGSFHIALKNEQGKIIPFIKVYNTTSKPPNITLSQYIQRLGIRDFKVNEKISFLLSNTTAEDAGHYVCITLSGDLIPGCGETLIITRKPTKPVLSGQTVAISGDTLTLSCWSTTTSLPSDHNLTMSYTWTRNGRQVQDNSLRGAYLILRSIKKEDNGVKYSCQVTETRGLKSDWSDTVTLKIKCQVEAADSFAAKVTITAAVLSVLGLGGTILCIYKSKKRREKRLKIYAAYITPVIDQHSVDSEDPSYATINSEDVVVGSLD